MTKDTADIARLLERTRAGEHQATSVLFSLLRQRVLPFCRRRTHGWNRAAADADDIAQEVCLAVMVSLSSGRATWDERSFWPLVFGIAEHKIADERRRVIRDRSDPRAELPDDFGNDAGPEEQAVRGESVRALSRLLSILPDHQRELLWWRLGLGMSAAEVAQALGCSTGSVRVRQHRALTRLRKHLEAGGRALPSTALDALACA
ncbi:sigma-70 family RNA polymerase sigma factor [Actinokineospora xionganensis]|uniref:Sigma-70 family RNA polymerase sigma factor n=1 Tax=Actinokineospora xionganensis TaxID=2684470 RepID=A0ABR7KZV9_9PSEU|nr:sigma-70 family RNA polymerase sigma factor [Actinokineospora xionganensis]MBC6445914.1 sigma-70 family RNA polymerase sigma factor [Actinokineospora xionganensis]